TRFSRDWSSDVCSSDLNKQISVSLATDIEEPISVWELDVLGGKDTVYVFSPSEINVHIEGIDEWLKIVGQEFVPEMGASRLIVEDRKSKRLNSSHVKKM